ncbi:hypothetical protein [Haloterrigena alkaliphila]|uniref:DUF2171 domain-containing protein n=1 Tax=Haloterrigena alkaliphila TaxID=2816475 RepID=A0A8A2VCS7_9EURY|nr:hypothetical protein [Haloterrigena alkaliphila]QSW98254.1 hypothetical protein J0X25_12695 [Haloterrigena alkaliphila]
MSHTFTDDDVDKRVETANGERIGVVTMTEPETAYVDLESDVADSTAAALDWDGGDEVVHLEADSVQAVTAETIRLAGDGKPGATDDDATDPVFDRDPEAVADERSGDRQPNGVTASGEDETDTPEEGRSGTAMEPETEEMDEAGEERQPDEEDRPPEGDRTVTKDRAEEQDR